MEQLCDLPTGQKNKEPSLSGVWGEAFVLFICFLFGFHCCFHYMLGSSHVLGTVAKYLTCIISFNPLNSSLTASQLFSL